MLRRGSVLVTQVCDLPALCALAAPADEPTCRKHAAPGADDGGGGDGGAAGQLDGASGSEQSEPVDGTRSLSWSEKAEPKRAVSG